MLDVNRYLHKDSQKNHMKQGERVEKETFEDPGKNKYGETKDRKNKRPRCRWGRGLCERLVDNTSPSFFSFSVSGTSASSLLPPTHPTLLIRLMVTDKQMKIFDKKQGHHTGTYWKHDLTRHTYFLFSPCCNGITCVKL